MPLPSLEKLTPVFDVVIPSTQETIQFRPFLVREEKVLLVALEENDEKSMLDAICQVISQCAMSPLKVDTLAVFDIEYIFLKLRSKSVSETAQIAYRCENLIEVTPEDAAQRQRAAASTQRAAKQHIRKQEAVPAAATTPGELVTVRCGNLVKVTVPLDQVEVTTDPEHTKKILLSDALAIVMRYPNVSMAKRMAKKGSSGSVNDALEGIAACVESVCDEQTVYSNFTTKEINDWLQMLPQSQFAKVEEFFETTPKLAYDVPFVCNACGYTEEIRLEGLASFFE